MSFYIPPKVKVVSVSREGTFENKLSFILPSEKNGNKFRQEQSLAAWLKGKECLGIDILDNVPLSGYFINKSIHRIIYSSFGSNTQKMRIYNNFGFEFEIDMKNMAMIAQSCDISKGEVLQECVLAWEGKKIIVLPTTSAEYFEFYKNIEKQNEEKKYLKEIKKSGEYNLRIGEIYKNISNKGYYVYVGLGRDINYRYLFNKSKIKDLVFNNNRCYLKVDTSAQHLFLECCKCETYGEKDFFEIYDSSKFMAIDVSKILPIGEKIKRVPILKKEQLNIGGNNLIDVSSFCEPSDFSYHLYNLVNEGFAKIKKNESLNLVSISGYMLNNQFDLIKFEINLTRYVSNGSLTEVKMSVICKSEKTNSKIIKEGKLDNYLYGSLARYFSLGLESTALKKVFNVKKTVK